MAAEELRVDPCGTKRCCGKVDCHQDEGSGSNYCYASNLYHGNNRLNVTPGGSCEETRLLTVGCENETVNEAWCRILFHPICAIPFPKLQLRILI